MLHLIHQIINYRHSAGYRIDRPEGNDMYSILLFRAPLDILQNGKIVRAPQNSCMIYDPFAPQLYYNTDSDYRHDGVFFRGEDLHPLFRQLGLPLNEIFQVAEPFAISTGIQNIASEAIQHRKHSNDIIDLRIRDLIYIMADSHALSTVTSHTLYHEFAALRRQVLLAPQQPWNAEELAAKMNISVSYFQHQYKNYFHTSLKRELISARLELAKYLLQASNVSIMQVSEQCGYNNVEHFIRQFQSHIGMPPSSYRKTRQQ